MTPREIVSELDRHIVGQHEAKRAVAIALRNRWRRQQLPEAKGVKKEVMAIQDGDVKAFRPRSIRAPV